MFFSHGPSHSRGVYVFLNPHSTFHLRRVEADPEGRFFIVKVTIDEECFLVTNIYAPTDYRDQHSFIRGPFRIQTPQKLLFLEIGILLLTQSISEVASLGKLQTIEIFP